MRQIITGEMISSGVSIDHKLMKTEVRVVIFTPNLCRVVIEAPSIEAAQSIVDRIHAGWSK